MFRNTDIDFRSFRPLPIGVIYRTSYENIPIVVLPIMVGDARVYLYDSEGGIDRLKETFFF